MSNAKIISIIDHENNVLRADIMRSIARAVSLETLSLEKEIELLKQRVSKLEEGVVAPVSD